MDSFRLFPPEAASGAGAVDTMFGALLLVSLFFLAVVFFPLIWFGIKVGSPGTELEFAL